MSEITRAVIGMPFEMAMENDLSRRQFHSRAQALLSENEALRGLYQMHKQTETREMRDLKAEVAGLKTGYEAYERVNAELRAECEALRKDKDRLDWLDRQIPDVRRQADDAMSKEQSHDN
ncbi:hypothetical protein RYA60_18470 [Pseudomonas syringae]|nr:hypothetical protein [Pseudomonas syringae]